MSSINKLFLNVNKFMQNRAFVTTKFTRALVMKIHINSFLLFLKDIDEETAQNTGLEKQVFVAGEAT